MIFECNSFILGKSELALQYLSLVVIESRVQNSIADSVWFLLHSRILCLSVFPRKYVVPAGIDIQLQRRNLLFARKFTGTFLNV